MYEGRLEGKIIEHFRVSRSFCVIRRPNGVLRFRGKKRAVI